MTFLKIYTVMRQSPVRDSAEAKLITVSDSAEAKLSTVRDSAETKLITLTDSAETKLFADKYGLGGRLRAGHSQVE